MVLSHVHTMPSHAFNTLADSDDFTCASLPHSVTLTCMVLSPRASICNANLYFQLPSSHHLYHLLYYILSLFSHSTYLFLPVLYYEELAAPYYPLASESASSSLFYSAIKQALKQAIKHFAPRINSTSCKQQKN